MCSLTDSSMPELIYLFSWDKPRHNKEVVFRTLLLQSADTTEILENQETFIHTAAASKGNIVDSN